MLPRYGGILDEDVARLSPPKDQHISVPGRFRLNIRAGGPNAGLRLLRDPHAPDERRHPAGADQPHLTARRVLHRGD
ncbi:hypothetical protein ACFVZR_26010 [Streptomyces sp. NPDC058316]|uniref:hypothetical protein n=1 Tax=unclassified Streptomyces TaxID=2593676 RepID=UPI003329A93A